MYFAFIAMENQKVKITIKPTNPNLALIFSSFFIGLKEYKKLGEANRLDQEVFLEKVKAQINILNIANKSDLEKLNELTTFKFDLDKTKLQSKIGLYIQAAEIAIKTIVDPEIKRLAELMRIKKEFGVVDNKPEKINSNESIVNPALIQINADLKPDIVYVKIEPARLTTSQITDYFTRLIIIKNPVNNKQFMSEKDLRILLARIVVGNNGDPKNGHYIALNLERRQKGLFMDFIYALYTKNESIYEGAKQKYVDLLVQNFDIFKEDNSLYKNMVPRKTKSTNPLLPK